MLKLVETLHKKYDSLRFFTFFDWKMVIFGLKTAIFDQKSGILGPKWPILGKKWRKFMKKAALFYFFNFENFWSKIDRFSWYNSAIDAKFHGEFKSVVKTDVFDIYGRQKWKLRKAKKSPDWHDFGDFPLATQICAEGISRGYLHWGWVESWGGENWCVLLEDWCSWQNL